MCSSKCIIVTVVVLVVIITVITLVATSLKKLDSNEIGIKYDTIRKKLIDSTEREGLHMGPPGFEFIIFPSVYTSLTFNHLEYKVRSDKLKDIILEFRDKDGYTKILRYEGESSIHESCSYFNTSQFQAERANFQEKVKEQIIVRYKNLNAEIVDLQVNNIARPTEYESAIRNKERAREDIRVANHERPRLLTEAETHKREAETHAKIIIDMADSHARVLANRAKTEAHAIIDQYEKETKAYKKIVEASGLGFTIDGFISYIGVRVIADAKNPVYIGLDSPANTVYP
ncbi:unnamed protein product [Mytilus edulis]|uniref:Band 7 domain-containing protein n=1 Tax=Mytilus edulis TaxID=6550 RepID=A0A8S3Q151_MYTED|nr:unnamed protein product [Mytilus edulis]